MVAPFGSDEAIGISAVLSSSPATVDMPSSPPSSVIVCARVASDVQCVGFADLVSVTI